jgi:hypothetical protein
VDSVKNVIFSSATALIITCEVCHNNIYVSIGPTNFARVLDSIENHKCELTTKDGKKIQIIGGDA